MAPFSKITSFFQPFAAANKQKSQPAQTTPPAEANRDLSSSLSSPPESIRSPSLPIARDGLTGRVQRQASTSSLTSFTSGPTSSDIQAAERPQAGIDDLDGASDSSIGSEIIVARSTSVPKPTTSTASTNPRPTGSSFHSSGSRRVVINNVKAVTNSDSEGLSDSSDDLLDLDAMLARKRRKITPPPGSIGKPYVVPDAAESTSTLRKKPKKKQYRHSLQSIVKQHATNAASESKLRDDEAALLIERTVNFESPTADDMVDAAISDESDKEHLKLAMDRLEANDKDEHFYYFRGVVEDDPQGLDFPMEHLEEPIKELCSEPARESFFTSGLAAEITDSGRLPDGVISWICAKLLTEQSPQLREAYIHTLGSVPDPQFVRTIRGACSLSACYRNSRTQARQNTQSGHLPDSLKTCLQMIRACAKGMDIEFRITTLFDMILLNMDHHVSQRPDLCSEIEEVMSALCTGVPGDMDDLIRQSWASLLEAELTDRERCRAVANIPATVSTLRQIRRIAAIHLILDVDSSTEIDLNSATTAARLLAKLDDDPRFAVRREINWSAFALLVPVLDTAIDNGFSDFSFLDEDRPAKPSLLGTVDVPPAETAFNKQIDQLCKRLHLMLNNISHGGTSGLRRTAAKETLESLSVRLAASARTRPRTSARVFGDKDMLRQKAIMAKFLRDPSEQDKPG